MLSWVISFLWALLLSQTPVHVHAAAPVVSIENFPLSYSYYTPYQSTQFINDTAILLSKEATVTDADNDNIQKAEIQITHGYILGDTLSYIDVSPISGAYNTGNGKVRGWGGIATINFPRSPFSSRSHNPPPPHTLS